MVIYFLFFRLFFLNQNIAVVVVVDFFFGVLFSKFSHFSIFFYHLQIYRFGNEMRLVEVDCHEARPKRNKHIRNMCVYKETKD